MVEYLKREILEWTNKRRVNSNLPRITTWALTCWDNSTESIQPYLRISHEESNHPNKF